MLGVRVDSMEMKGALDAIDRMTEAGGPARMVATVNPEFVMAARRDADFRQALERAELSLPDGHYVVWALRRKGCPQRDRVTGVDLVDELSGRLAGRAGRLFLLGARPGVAAEAGRRLAERHPGLVVCGAEPGSPLPEDDRATVTAVNRARPDVLLVAYGHPRQELWIDRNRQRLEVPVAIGVGGTFDYLSGRIRRAPRWMQRAHLEWTWRLMLQPWRARRMAVILVYLFAVLAEGRDESRR